MNKIDVSIIIVNYNTKSVTLKCINSIFEYTKKITFEVILVDNASTDGSREAFSNDKRIKFLYSKKNLGFGGGNNLGFQSSVGDCILLLNSDTVLLEDSISILYEFYRENEEKLKIGALGCVLVDENLNHNGSSHSFPHLSDFIKPFYDKYKKKTRVNELLFQNQDYTEVECITGADLFISRAMINRIGGLFDPNIFMYNEESELEYRIYKIGYKRIITNRTRIKHLKGTSLKTLSTENNEYEHVCKQLLMGIPSMKYFQRKHYSFFWRIINYMLQLLFFLPRIYLMPIDKNKKKEIMLMLLHF